LLNTLWYISYTSLAVPLTPAFNAEDINREIYPYIKNKKGRIGTIIMDFPAPSFIRLIIDSNNGVIP